MSYETCLTAQLDTGADTALTVTVEDIGNYTSAVAPLWAKALGRPLRDLNDCTAGDVAALLDAAVMAMERDKETYQAMVPTGAWGTYDGARFYLHRLRVACHEHPKATVQITS